MIWTVLGIEETKDKRAIKNAYRERLSVINPEEKPDEFKELRAAYEEAIKLADVREKPEEEKSELELWTDRLKELYFDLPRRLDVNAWKELLSCPLCTALDTRADAEDALLKFLMDSYQVSHEVMLFLEDQFGFSARMDELKEKFPQDFLQYVIDYRTRFDDVFPFALFTPGIDGKAADAYEELYRKTMRTSIEDSAGLYRQLEESSEKHPYGEALILKSKLGKDTEAAVEGLSRLHEKYPSDTHLALDLMLAFESAELPESVIKLADECLEVNPELFSAKRFKAKALAAKGDYKSAADLISRLLLKLVGEQGESVELDRLRRECNEAMIPQLQARLAEEPDDAEARYDLIWAFLQNNMIEEADSAAAGLAFEKPDPFSYYNAKSFIASEMKRLDEALDNSEKLLEAVDSLVPDGTERTEERIGRRPEVTGRISSLLFDLGREDEAVEMAEQSLDASDFSLGSAFNLVSMYFRTKHYDKAAALSGRIILNDSGNSGAYYFRAMSYYKMNNAGAAFDDVNEAISLDGTNLAFYLLKLRILAENKAVDAAEDLMEFLAKNGITNEPTVNYCKILLFAQLRDKDTKQEKYDGVLSLAAGVDEALSSGNYGPVDWAGEFYYQYASLRADRQDFDNDYPTEPIIELLDKGLALEPDSYPCRSYKAWLLKKSGKGEEALELYNALAQIPGHNANVEVNMAEIYYNDMGDHASDALELYQGMIEREPENADWYFYAGMCNYRMENAEEAENCFRLEQQYGPEDIDGYYRLAHTLLKLNRPGEALEQALKTVEIAKKRTGDTVRFFSPLIIAYLRLGRTDDAAAAVMDCAEKNPEWKYRDRLYEIYLQSGMYDKAEELCLSCRRNPKLRKAMDWQTGLSRVYMLKRRIQKLYNFTFNFNQYISPEVSAQAFRIFGAAKGRMKYYYTVAKGAYDRAVKENRCTSFERSVYAWKLFVSGRIEEARKMAETALEETRQTALQATGMRLMYTCRQVRLLAILGCEDEARQLSDECSTLLQCDCCDYRGCKDLAIYNCAMEIAFENYEKALEMALEGAKKWPDDADFIEFEYVIKAKTKRKDKK